MAAAVVAVAAEGQLPPAETHNRMATAQGEHPSLALVAAVAAPLKVDVTDKIATPTRHIIMTRNPHQKPR
jgi:hypothetical protein